MLTEFDEFVITKLPHFISTSYRSMLEKTTPEDKIRAILYVYDLGLRTLTLGLVSQYLIRDRDFVSDRYLDDLISEKLPEGTQEVWRKILFSTLKVYEGKRDLFFMPELYDFFWDISKMPHQPRAGLERSFIRLTQIHYDIDHGLAPTDIASWDSLLNETLGLFKDFISHFSFVAGYELIRVISRNGNHYRYERHVGLTISHHQLTLPETTRLERDCFYLSKQNKDFLLLDPLLIFWQDRSISVTIEEWDTGIFERFQSSQLRYLLSNIGSTVQDEKHLAAFVQLIFDTIRLTKQAQREVEKLTWLHLQDVARDISQKRMATVQEKYNSKLYLQRNKIRSAFDDFLSSDKKGFVLVGKSGVGKSNFILALADEYGPEHRDICLLMYDAANLDLQITLNDLITQGFNNYLHLKEKEIENVWHEISRIDDIREKKVVLCIDAINENEQGPKLLRQLNELIQEPWPWLKVIITSRPEAWLNIKLGVKLAELLYYRPQQSDKLFVEMEDFTYSQKLESFGVDELPLVYKKYQQAYQIQTDYETISLGVKSLLQDPLILWLTASIYQKKQIPTTMRAIDVIPDYIDAMLQTGRLERRDLNFLEKTLMPLMIHEGEYGNSIKAQQIDQVGQKLFNLINVESVLSNGRQVNQSFVNLMDTEVLVRRRESTEYVITFKYERFYDHFGGLRLAELFKHVQERYEVYTQLVSKTRESPFLWGPIKSLLITDLQRDINIAIPLAQSQEYFERELVTAALIDLGKDDRSRVTGIVTQLLVTNKVLHMRGHPSQGQKSGYPDKSLIRFGKLTAIEVASQLTHKATLLEAVKDSDEAIKVAAIQQIYHHLTLKNVDLVFDILDELAAQAFARWYSPSLQAIESHITISILILFNFFEDQTVLTKLQSRWNKIFSRVPLLGADRENGVRNQISSKVRDLILNIAVTFLIKAIHEMETARTVIASVEDLKYSFHQPRQDIQRLKRVVRYIDARQGSINNIHDDLVEIARSRDLLTLYVVTPIFSASFLSQKEDAIALAQEVFDTSLSETPPTLILAGIMLALESAMNINTNKFDKEFWSLHETMFQNLFQRSKNLVAGLHRSYYWGSYNSYYHDLHIGEEDSEMLQNYLTDLESQGDWVRLQVYIAFVSQTNLDKGLNHASASKLFRYLNHSNPYIKNSAIQAIASLRAKYTLEIDQLIKELNLPLEVTVSIENHRVHQNLGMIFTVSMYNFWTRAILHQDDRFINYVFEVVEYIDKSKNLRQFLVAVINRLIQLVYSGNVKT